MAHIEEAFFADPEIFRNIGTQYHSQSIIFDKLRIILPLWLIFDKQTHFYFGRLHEFTGFRYFCSFCHDFSSFKTKSRFSSSKLQFTTDFQNKCIKTLLYLAILKVCYCIPENSKSLKSYRCFPLSLAIPAPRIGRFSVFDDLEYL